MAENKFKKILIVNVNWLGDVLFSTPAIKAIKKHYPNSYLACMVVPRVAEVLEGNPNIDELIIFDEKGKHFSIFSKIKFILTLRRKGFDIVFLLHRSFTRALIIYLAGIPERIGYFTKKRSFLLTKNIPQPTLELHRSDCYSEIVEGYGINVSDKHCELFISDKNRNFIKELLNKEGVTNKDFLVVIHPGANWNLKRWPKENFAALADRLIEYFQAKIVFTGSSSDTSLIDNIVKTMKSKAINLCSKTNLKQLAALMEQSNLVISGDSGPMHIASCVGKNLIALFGPTDPKITGPIGKAYAIIMQKNVGCKIPCYELDCRDNLCMKTISVEDVLQQIRKIRY